MAHSPAIKWWSSPRQLLRTILMLDDTPHSIALGTAIGMFLGLTPTVGIQMILVILVSLAIGRFVPFNRIAALATVYISNPITTVPIYWFNYKVGTFFVAGDLVWDDFARVLEYRSFAEWWETIGNLFVEIGAPLIVGSLVVAAVGSVLTYPFMLWLIRTVRREGEPEELPGTPAGRGPAALSTEGESQRDRASA